MKLNSNFNDYYDTAIGYGIDSSIHYNRKEEVIKKPIHKNGIHNKGAVSKYNEVNVALNNLYEKIPNWSYFDVVYIGFCGKLYCAVKSFYPGKNYFYDIKSLKKFMKNSKVSDIINYDGWENSKSWWSFTRRSAQRRLKVKDISHDIFRDIVNAPIFTINRNELIINPRLFNIQFYKVLSPYETFQEISMYISNIFGGTSPNMIELSNKDKINKHGFGHKYAFRKEPE